MASRKTLFLILSIQNYSLGQIKKSQRHICIAACEKLISQKGGTNTMSKPYNKSDYIFHKPVISASRKVQTKTKHAALIKDLAM